jgi:hypothetical protein
VLGLGLVGGGTYELWGHRRAAGVGLLSGLGDRDAAMRVGLAYLAEDPAFDRDRVARDMHQRIAKRPLPAVLAEDAAQGRTAEIGGWVIPETLALLCALSAKVS